MRYARLTCPLCSRQLSSTLQCPHCKLEYQLAPGFLASTRAKLFFFIGALLLGSAFTCLHVILGIEDSYLLRILLDMSIGMVYYITCRYAFSRFQYVEGKPIPRG